MPDAFIQEYKPGPIPITPGVDPALSRYIEDELERIALLKEPRGAGAVTAVEDTVTLIPIENPPGTWNKLLVGVTEILDVPDGAWDSTTGTWTAPYGAFYDVELTLEWHNIGTQGGGTIQLFAGISVDGANPPGIAIQTDVPVGTTATVIVLSRLLPLTAGQTLEFYAEALSTQTAQTADVTVGVLITMR